LAVPGSVQKQYHNRHAIGVGRGPALFIRSSRFLLQSATLEHGRTAAVLAAATEMESAITILEMLLYRELPRFYSSELSLGFIGNAAAYSVPGED